MVNVVDNPLFADTKNCALLKEAVIEFILKNANQVLASASFDKLPQSHGVMNLLWTYPFVSDKSSYSL